MSGSDPPEEDGERPTLSPPGGPAAFRAEIPTLTDETELENARLASIQPSRPQLPTSEPSSDSSLPVVLAAGPTVELLLEQLAPLSRVPRIAVPSLTLDDHVRALLEQVDGVTPLSAILHRTGNAPEIVRTLVDLVDRGVIELVSEGD